MHSILTGRLGEVPFINGVARSMFELRHEIFHDKLQWEVNSIDGLEYDEFDDAHAVYIAARSYTSRSVDGCWRLRPTLEPNMLRDTFPQLLDGRPAPCSPNVWEISRFAVNNTPYLDTRYGFGEVSKDIIAATVDFALDNDISSYVMVTSVSVERMTKKLGYRMHRLGAAQRIGRVAAIAVEIPIDAHTCHLATEHKQKRLAQEAA